MGPYEAVESTFKVESTLNEVLEDCSKTACSEHGASGDQKGVKLTTKPGFDAHKIRAYVNTLTAAVGKSVLLAAEEAGPGYSVWFDDATGNQLYPSIVNADSHGVELFSVGVAEPSIRDLAMATGNGTGKTNVPARWC